MVFDLLLKTLTLTILNAMYLGIDVSHLFFLWQNLPIGTKSFTFVGVWQLFKTMKKSKPNDHNYEW
jgi:hypothetical protein